ncbi:MAG: bifunctional demethylmenaquinone methyltransferase/2-methoxy-6-polyprenyl-1,4-benzoquinol methylase UbiE [Planctomycetaceae bacterium]|nr:bifunctional demethylmenaquinone methyltransferase/2-methoxy-6-polyprenyl-1,4-benzoquinol methylase UbiE [Planctomycetaceae bacterium]
MNQRPDTHVRTPDSGRIAWNQAELAEDPHLSAEKAGKVRSMFASISRSYDLNNRLHSFGQDQRWRSRTVALAGVRPGDSVLDVACGTGDLTEAFARTDAGEVIGGDFTPEMLDQARVKADRLDPGRRPRYVHADAMRLDYEDERFDVVTIAFGIRNVTDPAVAIREFARVLRPGGRLVILEFAEPRNPFVRWGNRLYTNRIMPLTASLVARDGSGAYRYLPRSIETFHSPEDLADMMRSAGLDVVRQVPLTFGVCVASLAVRKS